MTALRLLAVFVACLSDAVGFLFAPTTHQLLQQRNVHQLLQQRNVHQLLQQRNVQQRNVQERNMNFFQLFEGGRIDKVDSTNKPNPNNYNVDYETASKHWTVSVQSDNNAIRAAGVPFMDSSSKDYFVDDETFVVARSGGLGMELLELAGGRADSVGMTIVQKVVEGGNAERAGIIAGDSIASIAVGKALEKMECRDFDATVEAIGRLPEGPEKPAVVDVKRMRRWPKVKVQVEYPKSQCAEGVDNVRTLDLFAGENLQRALLTRGIVLDDPNQRKCDFCGKPACYVRVMGGKQLLSPMTQTEELLFSQRPRERLSCKTVVGFNMQEGEVKLKVNLSQH